LLEDYETGIILAATLLLGFLFIIDSAITSSLKTPLSRLSVKVENAAIDEKIKKGVLGKTQEANETFKETLKKFGLLAIPTLIISLLGRK